ncbi:MAG: hypothetical protein K1X67_08715 [Fimbriimonadaceae bacterium]|nr:hypothetical protein [Fimbriimonadaceae bacterium]
MDNRDEFDLKITAWGKTRTVARWAQDPRATGDAKTILKRYQSGLHPESAIGFQEGDHLILPNGLKGITAWGKTKPVSEWARDPVCTVTATTVRHRLKSGWAPENAIATPSRVCGPRRPKSAPRKPCKTATAFGETKILSEWFKDERCKASRYALLGRIASGWDHELAITTPNLTDFVRQRTTGGTVHALSAFGETKTLADWSRDERCEVSATTIGVRLREGLSPEEAITNPSKASQGYKDKVVGKHDRFFITAFGETKDIRHWIHDKRCKVAMHTLRKRLSQGQDPEFAMTAKPGSFANGKMKPKYRAFGKEMTVQEWANDEKCVVSLDHLRARIQAGWDVELALTSPVNMAENQRMLKARKYTAFGETLSLQEWARHPLCRCCHGTLVNRLNRGADFELALTTPPGAIDIASGASLEKKRFIEILGEKKTLTEWLRDPRRVATPDAFKERLHKGWNPEEAFLTPTGRRGYAKGTVRPEVSIPLTAWGVTKTLVEWLQDPRCTINGDALRARLKYGWSPEDAISRPSRFAKTG